MFIFRTAADPAPVAITSYVYNAPGQNVNHLNTWDYGFEAENGIKQTASGSMKQVGEEEFVVMRGSYQYIGADGIFFSFCSVKKDGWSPMFMMFEKMPGTF